LLVDNRGSVLTIERDDNSKLEDAGETKFADTETYWPTVMLRLQLDRDPRPTVKRSVGPTFVLCCFLMRCLAIDQVGDRMESMSVCLISFILIFH